MELGQEDQQHNNTQITMIKGKRTKRQRSSSPFVVTAAMTSTSSSSGYGGGGEGERGAVVDDYSSGVSSPATTTCSTVECTEEEEDMAICLIMLAQSAGPKPRKNSEKPEKIVTPKPDNHHSGLYVYECKTCNRSFPSFQALGGHRASHKKPKTATEEKLKPAVTPPIHNSSEKGQKMDTVSISPMVSSQASNGNNSTNKGNKIHECSICGSEFSSGQALGGHMRRHRAVAAAASAAAAAGDVSNNNQVGRVMSVGDPNPGNSDDSSSGDRAIKQRKFLSLDLNLPAPEDDLRESKFQGLVFSAPALVDCHY